MKPLKPDNDGVFETYRNLLGFLKSKQQCPIWTGLSRNKESDDFSDELGNSITWFHQYKKIDSGSADIVGKKCVRKMTPKGWALADCLYTSLINLDVHEYENLFANDTYDRYLQWEDPVYPYSSPSIFIKTKILCEYEMSTLSEEQKTCVRENSTGQYHVWGTSVYFTKTTFRVEGQRLREQIGLTVSDSLENDELVWDHNANGIQTDQLQWYNDEQPRFKEPNCLATDCLSRSDHKITWSATDCSIDHVSLCTFSPPKVGKNEVAVRMSASMGTIENPYYGYFCLDETRTSCYLLFVDHMSAAKQFITERNFKVAVVDDDVKKALIAHKIRPHAGAFVGATSMRLGNKFEWMYQDKFTEVKFNSTYELPAIEQVLKGYKKNLCLILASNGSFVAAKCDISKVTLLDVSDDPQLDFMKIAR
ncbi:uncharacterized protein LOC142335079 isoform X2 [Convolutriloba macropyga]|uniref:uncharacterized protein LOC142335079 isoform X2 n=1 Tax=Convolutriloba macropyga TaxID=536237 RepID=UPI003F5254EB